MLIKRGQFGLWVAIIPKDTAANIAVSSNGDLTGFLKRTMDSAPTKPKDNAILPLITVVIPYVIIGRRRIVAANCLDLIQACLATEKLISKIIEDINNTIKVVPKSLNCDSEDIMLVIIEGSS